MPSSTFIRKTVRESMVDMANVIFSPDSAGIRKTHLKENWSRVFLAGKTESEDSSIHIGLGLVHRFDKIVWAQNLDFFPQLVSAFKKVRFWNILMGSVGNYFFGAKNGPKKLLKKFLWGVYIAQNGRFLFSPIALNGTCVGLRWIQNTDFDIFKNKYCNLTIKWHWTAFAIIAMF